MLNREALQKWMKTESAENKKKALHGLTHSEALVISKFMDNVSGQSYGQIEDFKTELRDMLIKGTGGTLHHQDLKDLIRLASENQMVLRGEDPTVDPHEIPAGTKFENMEKEIKALRAAGQTDAADAMEVRFNQFSKNRISTKQDKRTSFKKWESDKKSFMYEAMNNPAINEHNREQWEKIEESKFNAGNPEPENPDAKKED